MTIRPRAQYHVPGVFEQTNRGEKSYDLFSRMLEENIVFLGTPSTQLRPRSRKER